ncbi:MAG: DUF4249 domain-containing protein [Bacteroidota bacterium]
MKRHFLSVFFLTVLISSCTDTVDIDLPDGGARLVVDASINWEKGTSGQIQTIYLSESTTFFDANTNEAAIGAIVGIIKNDEGLQIIFEDQGDGSYVTNNFIPEVDQSYTLEILYNGQTYTAQETLIPMTEINDIEQTIEGDGSEEEIQIKVFFNDPMDTDDNYLGEFGTSVNPLITLAALTDEFTDGNENFIEFDNEELVPGAIVDISIYGISTAYYNYVNVLINQSGENDGPFQTTPVQLKGNCINPNNPDEEVLGYFRLSEVVKTSYIIQ